MRGVPGSGKSTATKVLRDIGECSIHSTDSLFMVDGEYKFNFEDLYKNHKRNERNFTYALEKDFDFVVCDNTNIKRRDFKPYLQFDFPKVCIHFEPSEPSVHFKRNTHGVPLETLETMCKNLIEYQDEFDHYLIVPNTMNQEEAYTHIFNFILSIDA